jgi:hypothetical protein
MKRIGMTSVICGAIGLSFIAFQFAVDFQPLWLHSVKNLPDKDTFTRQQVVGILVNQVEYLRARYLLGTFFSLLEIVGAALLLIQFRPADKATK